MQVSLTDAIHIMLCYYVYGREEAHSQAIYYNGKEEVEKNITIRIAEVAPVMQILLNPALDTDQKLATEFEQNESVLKLPPIVQEEIKKRLLDYKNNIYGDVSVNKRPGISSIKSHDPQANKKQHKQIKKHVSRFLYSTEFLDNRSRYGFSVRGLWPKPSGASAGCITCKRIQYLGGEQDYAKFFHRWMIKNGHENIKISHPEYYVTLTNEVFIGLCYRQLIGENAPKFRAVTLQEKEYNIGSKLITPIVFYYNSSPSPRLITNLIRNLVAKFVLGINDIEYRCSVIAPGDEDKLIKTLNYGYQHRENSSELFMIDFGDAQGGYNVQTLINWNNISILKNLLSNYALTGEQLTEQLLILAKEVFGKTLNTDNIKADHVVGELRQLWAVNLDIFQELASTLSLENNAQSIIKNLREIQEIIFYNPVIFPETQSHKTAPSWTPQFLQSYLNKPSNEVGKVLGMTKTTIRP